MRSDLLHRSALRLRRTIGPNKGSILDTFFDVLLADCASVEFVHDDSWTCNGDDVGGRRCISSIVVVRVVNMARWVGDSEAKAGEKSDLNLHLERVESSDVAGIIMWTSEVGQSVCKG